MNNVDRRVSKIENSCYETARKESKMLKIENDSLIDERKSEMVASYKEELAKKYVNDINKMKKEFNRNVFDYERTEQKKVSDFEDTLRNNIKLKVEKEIKDFILSNDYERFLFENVDNALKQVGTNEYCIVYLVENDFYKYKDNISKKYNVQVEKINDENIGGAIVVDTKNRIRVDNTLKNNIQEKMREINI